MLYGYYRAVNKPVMSVVLAVISLGMRVLLAYVLSSYSQKPESKLFHNRSFGNRVYGAVNNNDSGAYSYRVWRIFCDYL